MIECIKERQREDAGDIVMLDRYDSVHISYLKKSRNIKIVSKKGCEILVEGHSPQVETLHVECHLCNINFDLMPVLTKLHLECSAWPPLTTQTRASNVTPLGKKYNSLCVAKEVRVFIVPAQLEHLTLTDTNSELDQVIFDPDSNIKCVNLHVRCKVKNLDLLKHLTKVTLPSHIRVPPRVRHLSINDDFFVWCRSSSDDIFFLFWCRFFSDVALRATMRFSVTLRIIIIIRILFSL